MPKITDVQRQQKNTGRYSIFIDGKYSFSLSDLDLSSTSLSIDQEVSQAELDQLVKQSSEGKAYAKALGYLNLRRRSRQELAQYLLGKDFDDLTIGQVLSRLEANGLVDDLEFARAWVRDRQILKPRSRRMLTQELRQKGIPADVVDQVISDIDPDHELISLVQMIQKKLARSNDRDQNKLITYFLRRGYDYDLVQKAIRFLDEGT